MALEECNQIDAIGISNEKDCVTLAIFDSHDWIEEEHHLLMLQEKLNTYLRFIESGEIYTAYEDSVGRKFEIVIHFKENYPQRCKTFLESVQETIESAGFMFSYKVG